MMPIAPKDHRKQTMNTLSKIIKEMPKDWLTLTTHRLDIYDESRAKVQFIEELLKLVSNDSISQQTLSQLPSAFDYVRLGHQLSSVYEWGVAQLFSLNAENVISFASKMMPLMAVLRTNTVRQRDTIIYHDCTLPSALNSSVIPDVYGYTFQTQKIEFGSEIPEIVEATQIYLTITILWI